LIEIFHCFGAKPDHRVSADVAVRMLQASRCRYLAVNTHTIDNVRRGDDLPVGYADATLGTVTARLGPFSGVTPVLNINHPRTAREATDRTTRAVELTGIHVIKLEVLDPTLTVTDNAEVVRAAAELIGQGFEVWPLISADTDAYRACVDLGATMVRVMGSPIGARRGIDEQARQPILEILADHRVPVMLDGGIGSVADLVGAGELGFDAALVNSCLFAADDDPVAKLAEMRAAIDATVLPEDAIAAR
jgi:thiazole synthase